MDVLSKNIDDNEFQREQASESPLPGELNRIFLIASSTGCDNAWEMFT